jgi:signal transduction histidine kinase
VERVFESVAHVEEEGQVVSPKTRAPRKGDRRREWSLRNKLEDAETQSTAECILNSIPSGVLAIDNKKRILFCNARCEEILRTSAGDILGKDCREVIQAGDDRWMSADPVDALGAPDSNREVRVEVGDEELELLSTPIPLNGPSGETLGTVVLLENAAEAEIDEESLKTDRLVSLGELSACVAHEIRNPLTGIRTTVQFIGSKFPQEDPRRQDVEDIVKELDRIEQIITDLLVFARPPMGKPIPISANEAVIGALDTLELQLESESIAVEKNLASDLPQVNFDPDLMHQVFLNILRNAVEAMPDGGRLKVTTSSRRTRSRNIMVDISFSDQGCGIEQEHMDKIFTPFFTTRPMGTGLGLPISLQIVRGYGGTITAKNNPRAGATFRVSVPAVEEGGRNP